MKKIFLLSFLFLFTGLVTYAQLTITATVCGEANSVRLTGPWWGWGPAAGPEAADNGDGTWTFTFPDTPTENMEYKLVVDGSMEDLVSGGGFSCTPITDNSNYANRLWTVGAGNVTGITYGTCASSCDGLVISGCTDASALNYNQNATSDNGTCSYGSDLPINFEGSSYETSAFDGASIEIIDNPFKTGINTSSKVVKVVRNGGQKWAGLTIVTKPIDFFEDSIFKMKVYSPNVNIPVTVKFESSAGGNTGEFVVNTTKANQWEELTVNFGDEQPSDVFQHLMIIFNKGTIGDGSANSTYYLDDIRFDSQTVDNTAPVAVLLGCMDANASDYNAEATLQATDEHGNLLCAYASCEDIPISMGCLFSESFAYYTVNFGSEECKASGGVTCGPESVLMIEDFESGAINPDWDGFFQSGVYFPVIRHLTKSAQGEYYFKMHGECSWDWLIGMVNIPASAFGNSTFDLSDNAEEVYFNVLLNVPEGIDNAKLLIRFKEDDNLDGVFDEGDEDEYTLWYDDTNLDYGWQKISVKYSDLLAGGDNPTEPVGNAVHNPDRLKIIDILLLADPSSGYTRVDIDYMYFSSEPVCNFGNGICREGCTNSTSDNYDPYAVIDDGSCIVTACPYAQYFEYDSNYTHADVSMCQTYIIEGCTHSEAENYNTQANKDDGSCIVEGCMNPSADNYNTMATYEDENSCLIYGCSNSNAENYQPEANFDDGTCIIGGCTLIDFMNYNSAATYDDGSCDPNSAHTYGCTDSSAVNYSSEATQDNGTCEWLSESESFEMYMPEGWSMFGYTCWESIGVEDAFAGMEDKIVIVKDGDGNPYLPEYGFNGLGNLEYARGYQLKLTEEVHGFSFCGVEGGNHSRTYEIGDLAHGGIVFYLDETGQHGLVAAMEDLTEGATDPKGWGYNGYEWGCYEESLNGADGQAIGTGHQNTLDIANQGCTTEYGGITGAQAALDAEINGYSDWYLPSLNELLEMYNTIGNGSPEGNIGGFETDFSPYYWSSSEGSNYNAWFVSFYSGTTFNYFKNGTRRVRVIRAF